MTLQTSRTSRGFTLIELLIVVAIIAILAAIAVPNFLEAQTRSKVSRAFNDHRSYATAMEAYMVDWNAYPPDQDNKYNIDLESCRLAQQMGMFSNLSCFQVQTGFTLLTTPIAYLTSMLTDPFQKPGLGESWDGDPVNTVPNPDKDALALWNAPYYTSGVGSNNGGSPERAGFFGGWGDIVHAYVLVSMGPDKMNSTREIDFWPVENQSNGVIPYLWCYDPTNGTVSVGDIYRFGGDYRAGNAEYFLNDVPFREYGAFGPLLPQK